MLYKAVCAAGWFFQIAWMVIFTGGLMTLLFSLAGSIEILDRMFFWKIVVALFVCIVVSAVLNKAEERLERERIARILSPQSVSGAD